MSPLARQIAARLVSGEAKAGSSRIASRTIEIAERLLETPRF